jgi:hypothetical protein
MELLLILLVFVAAFQLGKMYGFYKVAMLLRQVADEQGIDLEKELGLIKENEENKEIDIVRKLMVEQHGEVLYLFDKETDEFIVQGASVQELAELAMKNKKIDFAAVLFGQKVFRFINGKSTEVEHA